MLVGGAAGRGEVSVLVIISTMDYLMLVGGAAGRGEVSVRRASLPPDAQGDRTQGQHCREGDQRPDQLYHRPRSQRQRHSTVQRSKTVPSQHAPEV